MPIPKLLRFVQTATYATRSARDRLQVGSVLECRRDFSPEDVTAFVTTTGDSNPIHTDRNAAEASGFSGRVLPGVLCASLFPALIGSNFPGAIYLSQTLKFRVPALVGDCVTARITVEKVSGSRVAFKTECLSGSGVVLVDGVAMALMPGRQ
ncbi:probable (R)-specific enoyl-CoA hydratase [Coccomyxa sp. Obi]|nr:probable (R)-specific enoyl-CoA hydratase [Coccomyxa sp. Obi]